MFQSTQKFKVAAAKVSSAQSEDQELALGVAFEMREARFSQASTWTYIQFVVKNLDSGQP
jgi:hypothetical protein